MKNSLLAINTHGKSIGLCLGALFCAWLAFSAFMAAQAHAQDGRVQAAFANPYIIEHDSVLVQAQANVIDQQLEFMVWDRERRALSLELSDLLREQINIEPFNFDLWRRLSFAELDAGRSSENHAFALRQALVLGKWHSNQRIVLLHHCILAYSNLERIMPSLCKAELNSIPDGINLHWVASRAGVSFDQLNAVFERAGVAKPKKTEH